MSLVLIFAACHRDLTVEIYLVKLPFKNKNGLFHFLRNSESLLKVPEI